MFSRFAIGGCLVYAAMAGLASAQAVRAQQVVAPPAQLDAMKKQALNQLRNLLQLEFAFLRRACQPTEEQYQAMKQSVGQESKAILTDILDDQMRLLGNGMIARFAAQPLQQPVSPQATIQNRILQIVTPLLPPEALDRYRQEIDAREAFRRQADVALLVSLLDQRLNLDDAQRQRLVESIDKVWDPGWEGNLQIMVNQPEFVPQIPDEAIVPILNREQTEIWQEIPKSPPMFVQQNWVFGGAIRDLVVEGELEFEDPELELDLPAEKGEVGPPGASGDAHEEGEQGTDGQEEETGPEEAMDVPVGSVAALREAGRWESHDVP